MRNPLSAILQCADTIMSLQQASDDNAIASPEVLSQRMRDTADSAETILQCGKHMKTIVDGEAPFLEMHRLVTGLCILTQAF